MVWPFSTIHICKGYINPRLSYGSRNKKRIKKMEKEDLVLEDLSWFYVVVDFTDNMIQKQMIE